MFCHSTELFRPNYNNDQVFPRANENRLDSDWQDADRLSNHQCDVHRREENNKQHIDRILPLAAATTFRLNLCKQAISISLHGWIDGDDWCWITVASSLVFDTWSSRVVCLVNVWLPMNIDKIHDHNRLFILFMYRKWPVDSLSIHVRATTKAENSIVLPMPSNSHDEFNQLVDWMKSKYCHSTVNDRQPRAMYCPLSMSFYCYNYAAACLVSHLETNDYISK
jgi:hypothetical protein